jgi:hypothetical protein
MITVISLSVVQDVRKQLEDLDVAVLFTTICDADCHSLFNLSIVSFDISLVSQISLAGTVPDTDWHRHRKVDSVGKTSHAPPLARPTRRRCGSPEL